MKLLNFRCHECGLDDEIWDDDLEAMQASDDQYVPLCLECGGVMDEYNFKNNIHRYRLNDLSDRQKPLR